MVRNRAQKIQKLQDVIAPLEVIGESDTLILGWGSTKGTILSAIDVLKDRGIEVASAHLHHINPFPKNLGEVLHSHKQVIIPELNTGQLRMLIRSEFMVDAVGINNLAGRAFFVNELADEIESAMKGGSS